MENTIIAELKAIREIIQEALDKLSLKGANKETQKKKEPKQPTRYPNNYWSDKVKTMVVGEMRFFKLSDYPLSKTVGGLQASLSTSAQNIFKTKVSTKARPDGSGVDVFITDLPYVKRKINRKQNDNSINSLPK